MQLLVGTSEGTLDPKFGKLTVIIGTAGTYTEVGLPAAVPNYCSNRNLTGITVAVQPHEVRGLAGLGQLQTFLLEHWARLKTSIHDSVTPHQASRLQPYRNRLTTVDVLRHGGAHGGRWAVWLRLQGGRPCRDLPFRLGPPRGGIAPCDESLGVVLVEAVSFRFLS